MRNRLPGTGAGIANPNATGVEACTGATTADGVETRRGACVAERQEREIGLYGR